MVARRRRLPLVVLSLAAAALAGCVAPAATDAAPPEGGPAEGAEGVRAPPGVFHFAVPGADAEAGVEPEPTGVVASGSLVGTARYSGDKAFEPTLGVTSDGKVFLGHFGFDHGPGLTGAVGGFVNLILVKRTDDDGLTWTDVTPQALDGAVSWPPNSNDPYVYVDPSTDRIFLLDIQALACNTMSYSDDDGATWKQSTLACGLPPGGQDHQTIWAAKPRVLQTSGYPNILHYCVNRIADTACARSLDGGDTFGPLTPLVFRGVDPGRPGAFCGGLASHGVAAPDGTLYMPKAHCSLPMVAVSEDDGQTWTQRVISTRQRVLPSEHDVHVATDEAGNVYAFWLGADALPYLSRSTDKGATWSAPVMVAAPGVQTASFGAIDAGAPGRVAFSYYGTTSKKAYGQMDADDTWNAYIGVIEDALAPVPLVQSVAVNPASDPVARGRCDGGNRCDKDAGAGVGDFLDLVIDAEGRPWAAFVDVCTASPCNTPAGKTNSGTAMGMLGTLAAGPRLRGPAGPLPPLAS